MGAYYRGCLYRVSLVGERRGYGEEAETAACISVNYMIVAWVSASVCPGCDSSPYSNTSPPSLSHISATSSTGIARVSRWICLCLWISPYSICPWIPHINKSLTITKSPDSVWQNSRVSWRGVRWRELVEW